MYAVSQMTQNDLIFVEIIIVILQGTHFDVFLVCHTSQLDGGEADAPSRKFRMKNKRGFNDCRQRRKIFARMFT